MTKQQLKRSLTRILKKQKILFILLLFLSNAIVQAQCVSGCNSNSYINSSAPNTIEYDNMVSGAHGTIVKDRDGSFKIWGSRASSDGGSNLLSPTALTTANGYAYGGTPLKATVGDDGTSHQYALLSSDGLYIWGAPNMLVSSLIKNTAGFAKITVNLKTDGLPAGVSPSDVKMMFGSYRTLAIVTCTGEAWVLSFNGAKNGDGTAEDAINNVIWHRVRTSVAGNPTLDNVVAMRGTPRALFALTSTGKLYTWGTSTYINSGGATTRAYATEVTVPAGATPKMIGMTSVGNDETYYLLANDGKLYSMGSNSVQ